MMEKTIKNNMTIVQFIKKHISITAFILIFVIFAISDLALDRIRFLSPENFLTIIEQAVVVLVVSFGMTFIIMMGSIDLSVGSTVGFAGVIAAAVLKSTNSTVLAVLAGIGVGAAVGIFNGVVHSKMKIPSFITTLGTMSIVRALAVIYSQGSVIMVPFESAFKQMGVTPGIIIIGVIFYVLAFVLQKLTVFGRYIKMIGGDENVAIMSGIKVAKYKIINYVLCGVLAGIGGLILAARIGSGAPSSGKDFEMDCISSVVLGGTAMTGGVGSINGTVVGALTLAMIANGMVLVGIPTEVQPLVKGFVLIIAVFISLERDKIGIIK
jgi:ribose/xylose/arabinose/galactoside ABC-type transport system permease subunit